MTQTKPIRFLRPDETMRRCGCGNSKFYARISDGTFPPVIKFGRASAHPEHEVDAMLTAVAAGATDDELRKLVQQLVAQRKAAFAVLTTPSAA